MVSKRNCKVPLHHDVYEKWVFQKFPFINCSVAIFNFLIGLMIEYVEAITTSEIDINNKKISNTNKNILNSPNVLPISGRINTAIGSWSS